MVDVKSPIQRENHRYTITSNYDAWFLRLTTPIRSFIADYSVVSAGYEVTALD